MFNKNNTLKEISQNPVLAPYADKFVAGLDLSGSPFFEKTIYELSAAHIFYGYSLLNGFNRLYEAASEGTFCYKLYSEDEIKDDPKKDQACFMLFSSMDPDADNRPFVVCVPGGGNVQIWNMTEGFPIANHYNQLGYHVVILNYRYGGPGLYPAPLEDMAKLLDIIDDRQKELHLWAGHYFTIGFSAGAYLINTWGTSNHGYLSYGKPKPVINVSVYGFVSWKGVRDNWHIDSFGINTHGLPIDEVAKTDWNVEDHLDVFPPTYILHGDNDHSCDCNNSLILADALKEAGIPYVLEIGKGMDHGFGEALFSSLRGYLERTINFLNDHM